VFTIAILSLLSKLFLLVSISKMLVYGSVKPHDASFSYAENLEIATPELAKVM
jgi:hypothetical protein